MYVQSTPPSRSDLTVQHHCPPSQASLRDFELGMQLCISSAVNEHGFTHITFTPHIDSRDTGDGWTIRAWRNGLVLDPRQKWVALVFTFWLSLSSCAPLNGFW